MMLISTDLNYYSAVQQSCTPSSTCSFIFFRRVEPSPFFNDRAFKNSNCSKRRSFQIMRYWQIIVKWLGIAYIDWCGNKMEWIWCFLSSSLKFHKQYCQFHFQQPITSRIQERVLTATRPATTCIKFYMYIVGRRLLCCPTLRKVFAEPYTFTCESGS
jgi:hypothetical protein